VFSVPKKSCGAGTNSYGIPGDVQERFNGNDQCQNAFKNFACFLNFPRCDNEKKSLVMCRSVCENFFKACNVSLTY
jgi:hypothetical protein